MLEGRAILFGERWHRLLPGWEQRRHGHRENPGDPWSKAVATAQHTPNSKTGIVLVVLGLLERATHTRTPHTHTSYMQHTCSTDTPSHTHRTHIHTLHIQHTRGTHTRTQAPHTRAAHARSLAMFRIFSPGLSVRSAPKPELSFRRPSSWKTRKKSRPLCTS